MLISHDGDLHLYRLLDFDLAFRAGNLWPRIAPHLAQDFGYATFTFYSPGAVYLGEVFRLLGLGYITSIKSCFAVSIVLSGLGAYMLARELFGSRAGTVAGLIYLFLPYRLLDVYTRGDLAESLGLAVLPFVFWGFWRVAQRPTVGRAMAAGTTLALLIVAHNLTAVFAIPMLGGFILVAVGRRWTQARIIGLGLAGFAALLLSAAYWVPVVVESAAINSTALTEGFYDFHGRFFTLENVFQRGWAYDYRFDVGMGLVFSTSRVQAIAVGIAAAWTLVAPTRNRRLVIAGLITICFLLWMEQAGSTWLWDRLPFVRFLQFPYRMSIYITLATSMVLGSLAGSRPSSDRAGGLNSSGVSLSAAGGLALGIAAVLVISITSMWQIPSAREPTLESQVSLPTLWRVEQTRKLIATSTHLDFIPKWTPDDIFGPTPPLGSRQPTSENVPAPIVTARWLGPLELAATVDNVQPGLLTFDRIYYQSWQATIDGQAALLAPVGRLGLISLAIPAGVHEIRLTADGTPVERAALLVSVIGAVALTVYWVWRIRKRQAWLLVCAGVVLALAAAILTTQLRPPRQLAGGITFGESVRLVGSTVNQAVDSAGAADVTLMWEEVGPIPPNCVTHFRLLDSDGRVVAGRDKVPLFGVRSCTLWQEGVLIRDETQIRLPEGKASGPYRLAVAFSADGHDLVPAQSPQIIEWREDDGSTSRGAVLGTIDVPAFFESIPKLTGSALDAHFAQNIALETAAVTIGPVTNAEVSGDRRFIARLQSGDEISADLLWRSIADVSVDYSVFAHLIGPTDAIVAQDDLQPSVSNFPTSVWYPGEKRIDSVQVLVPPSIGPGVYRLVTGLYNRDDQVRLGVASGGIPGDQVLLGRFKVEGNDQTFGKPFAGEPRQALLAGTIALDGSALSSTDFRPGGKLSVGLIWKAIQRPMTDYTVFVHILDETDHVVAQVDSFPLGGTFETSDWDIGDTIYDSRDISLPTDLKSGTYSVEVGLYDAASGTRLTTATGDTSIRFGSLVVVGH